MMLYSILVGLMLASSYCRADDPELVKRQTTTPAWSTIIRRFEKIEKQLAYGGKQYQAVPYRGALPLRNHDYIKLQLMGARNAWLGCPDAICDLRTCPSVNQNYLNFNGLCWGEEFQIISDGAHGSAVKSGQQIRLRYLRERNTWMGCPSSNRCDKRPCPGTTAQGSNFRNNRCWGEIFRIYARGRANGEVMCNGDLVMIYYPTGGKYVSIQGENYGDDTSLNFCPGVAPPAYFSYGICSKNVFRIYRKP